MFDASAGNALCSSEQGQVSARPVTFSHEHPGKKWPLQESNNFIRVEIMFRRLAYNYYFSRAFKINLHSELS